MTVAYGIMNILPCGPYFNVIWLCLLGEELNDKCKK